MNDGLTPQDREKIQSVLMTFPKVARVLLFGSRALGTYKASSDIDFAVEGKDLTLSDLLEIKAKLCDQNIPVEVDLLIRANISNSDLENHIRTYGKVWWTCPKIDYHKHCLANKVSIKDISNINEESYSKNDKYAIVRYLDTGNITENKINEIIEYDVKTGLLPSRAKRKVKHLDIIYSCVRPNQRHYGIIHDPPKNFLVSTGFAVISVDKNKANPFYIYYFLTQKIIVDSLQSIAEGDVSTYPTIKGSDIGDVSINLPPLFVQDKIAAILSSLDDKIELNHKINANLEAQTQALFKSWFVDFEPFQDGEFVDSELGLIPKGWEVSPLGALCKIITKGTTPTTVKKSFVQSGINFIKAETILSNHTLECNKFSFIDIETHGILMRSQLMHNDIVFTIAGTIGRFAIIDKMYLPANINQAVAIIRADPAKIDSIVLYTYFISHWHISHYSKNTQQAVQANLSLTSIRSLPILVASSSVMESYKKIIFPIMKQIQINTSENALLSNLRDTLLPKLMSGEIRVVSE